MKNLPVWFERIENVAIAIAVVVAFVHLHFTWYWLLVLFLAFDISMVGYLLSNRFGANLYNVIHSYIGPALLLMNFTITSTRWCAFFGLVWAFHIAVDRIMGYGLKYPTGFQDTLLGKIGKR